MKLEFSTYKILQPLNMSLTDPSLYKTFFSKTKFINVNELNGPCELLLLKFLIFYRPYFFVDINDNL